MESKEIRSLSVSLNKDIKMVAICFSGLQILEKMAKQTPYVHKAESSMLRSIISLDMFDSLLVHSTLVYMDVSNDVHHRE